MAQQQFNGTSFQIDNMTFPTSITVPNSGHWIAEEQPEFLVNVLNNFLSGNSTTSSG